MRRSAVPVLVDDDLWQRLHLVAPLVIVGTVEDDGSHDLAPKHMAMPMSWGPLFGFVCSPTHRTWHNAIARGEFTVSYLRPDQILDATFAAGPRHRDGSKPTLDAVQTEPAHVVGGVVVAGARTVLECRLHRVVEDLGPNGLLIGEVVAARALPRAVRDPDVDDADLVREEPLLVYAHPDRFGALTTTHAIPLHLGFRR